ncbi:heparinase II/III family protein [Pseudoduganella sp. LjRoot289]|uniref:heparinase II/III domain-containing protein n=1 Tax=Pseudoduganella sp. LjRoot289 TaxID=3342314 RepID=UPI003ECFECE2
MMALTAKRALALPVRRAGPAARRRALSTRGLALAVLSIGLALQACAKAGQGGLQPLPQAVLVPGVEAGREALRTRIARDDASAKLYEAIRAGVQPYVARHAGDPAWIVSRLQMYWQAKHTQVYVKNGYYDHAEGTAPVATVRFTGARDTSTAYATPKLEDVKPYMGENDLLYLQNRSAPGQPWEWAAQAKTGRIVESINMRIAELARDAAFVYWYSGDEAYAKFAYDIFDTYMSGLYYREMPLDLNRGHDQTLVGLQSFEVIHEDIAGPLAETYDFMRAYAAQRAGDKRAVHEGAFKKWADLILANGVPWNNWNLIKARFVLQIAAVLGDDEHYPDKHGKRHYVQAVIEGKGARQWSLRRLLDAGYDSRSAMWNESPGYSMNVVGDYLECLEMLERVFGIDLLPQMPILPRTATALPQYLLPNGRTVGFGDTRYDYMRTAAIERLRSYAVQHGRTADARSYGALLDAVRSAGDGQAARAPQGDKLHLLLGAAAPANAEPLAAPGLGARPAPAAGALAAYQTPTYYAPNASWLVQRNGYDKEGARGNALVISQVGSSGNHAHANGIAMELYAQGLSLAPESGRGSGYFQLDHKEYYAQFAAHNTVVVDGKSTYASMKSNHPLAVQAVYPQPGTPAAGAFPLVTFSAVAFREPETDADQQRVMGTVRLDDKTGYFIDIFRSRRRDGADRYHDYIYHNLGQSMRFLTPSGEALAVAASSKLAFADNDLIGYDYWWDRKSLTSGGPLKAQFDLALPERSVSMTAWLQGGAKREYFSVKAPPSTAWPAGMLPAGIDALPLPTLVVRQSGQAWTRPFTAVFEASGGGTGASVLGVEEIVPAEGAGHAVALRVSTQGGRRQTIMSGDGDKASYEHAGQRLLGRYGIAAERAGALDYLFLGHGKEVAGQGYALKAAKDGASAALWQAEGRWFLSAGQPVLLSVPVDGWPRQLAIVVNGSTLNVSGRDATAGGRSVRVYALPAMPPTAIR